MPSPVGHALAGLAVGWVAECLSGAPADPPPRSRTNRSRRAAAGYPLLAVAMALLPDFDLLLNSHRTLSHSLGGAALAGCAGWALALALRRPATAMGLVCAAATGSHALLDWLGRDTSAPSGLMLLWPVSREFYSSGLALFAEVSRRYWNPHEFILGNFRSVARELLLLGPLATAAFVYRRRVGERAGERHAWQRRRAARDAASAAAERTAPNPESRIPNPGPIRSCRTPARSSAQGTPPPPSASAGDRAGISDRRVHRG
ncbi:MAG: metal-dependent hydrolase [Acidobacteriota bacterium]